jgi:hypothetical protein
LVVFEWKEQIAATGNITTNFYYCLWLLWKYAFRNQQIFCIMIPGDDVTVFNGIYLFDIFVFRNEEK